MTRTPGFDLGVGPLPCQNRLFVNHRQDCDQAGRIERLSAKPPIHHVCGPQALPSSLGNGRGAVYNVSRRENVGHAGLQGDRVGQYGAVRPQGEPKTGGICSQTCGHDHQ